MAIKKTTSKKQLQNNVTAIINELHSYIDMGHYQLPKLYKKSVSEIGKKVDFVAKSLAKVKKGVIKAKKNKKKAPKAYHASVSQAQTLSTELKKLKSEQALTTSGYKKLIAQQKVLQQFEKQWIKKTTGKKRTKKKPNESKANVLEMVELK